MEQQKEYRSIVKATALFGGVQAFQVLLTLVRTKVVALLLGVDGVGLLGMFNNAISMVQSITGLGINQGGVKSLSSAEDPRKAAQIATLIRQMSLYAGLLGAVVVLALPGYHNGVSEPGTLREHICGSPVPSYLTR